MLSPWAGLVTWTEELVFCSDSGFCQNKFSFTLCRCVVFWKFVMLSRQCTGRSLCDDVTYC